MAERLTSAREKGETLSVDIAQDPHNLAMFMRYAEQYGGDSAAAHMLMESELARQAPKPTRIFSDGTAMPASFSDVRQRYEKTRTEPAFDANVDGIRSTNDAQVSSVRRTPSPMPSNHLAPTPIRTDVQTHAARIRAEAQKTLEKFDATSNIAPNDDGTLETKKSLLKQTGKQVEKDAGAILDNTKDIVKGILSKDQ